MKVAVIVVSVGKMLTVFRMQQVCTVRAGFVPALVEGKNLVGNRHFSDAVFCFTADYSKVLFIEVNMFLFQIKQVHDAEIELLASRIAHNALEKKQTEELEEKTQAIVAKNESLENEYECISRDIEDKRAELQTVNQNLIANVEEAEKAASILERIKAFVSAFKLFAPTIEEYANQVEADKSIEAGNSYRGILYELGRLLEAFKELIKEGLCWFPRLMKWNTSKGDVAPVFTDHSNGYSYKIVGYMNVNTKECYSKEAVQEEIKADNRTGTMEQMDANIEAMARDVQEILRISAEQKSLWDEYERR